MPEIARVIATEEAVDWVLAKLKTADPQASRTLGDWLTDAGLFNPYRRAAALRMLRAALKPTGTHGHLSRERRWAYERERWAKDAGLSKGRTVAEFEPETEATRALVEAMDANEFLPATAREAVNTIRQTLAVRANRKLDQLSAEFIGESVEELMHEVEVQGRLMEEKDARIKQAERHAEDLRRTNERLLMIMEQLTGKPTAEGSLTPSEEREGEDKGGARQRTN